MKIKTINIVISRDPMSKLPKSIWPWELEMFNLQWPGGLVEVIGEGEPRERAELPDAQVEYNRLLRTFGQEQDTGINLVDIAFERGPKGVKLLEKAIKAAVVKAKAPPRKKAAAKKAPTSEAK